MSGCNTIHTPTTPVAKACSGKCLGSATGCKNNSQVWVIAACEGMITMFTKEPDGHMTLLPQGKRPVFSSMEAFRNTLVMADADHLLDQLVIVGSRSDIAWMHAALPEHIAKHISAEINYPLVAEWFKGDTELNSLTRALEQVFKA